MNKKGLTKIIRTKTLFKFIIYGKSRQNHICFAQFNISRQKLKKPQRRRGGRETEAEPGVHKTRGYKAFTGPKARSLYRKDRRPFFNNDLVFKNKNFLQKQRRKKHAEKEFVRKFLFLLCIILYAFINKFFWSWQSLFENNYTIIPHAVIWLLLASLGYLMLLAFLCC